MELMLDSYFNQILRVTWHCCYLLLQILDNFIYTKFLPSIVCCRQIFNYKPHWLVIGEAHFLKFTLSVQLVVPVVRCFTKIFHVSPYQHLSETYKVAVVFILHWTAFNTLWDISSIYETVISLFNTYTALTPKPEVFFWSTWVMFCWLT